MVKHSSLYEKVVLYHYNIQMNRFWCYNHVNLSTKTKSNLHPFLSWFLSWFLSPSLCWLTQTFCLSFCLSRSQSSIQTSSQTAQQRRSPRRPKLCRPTTTQNINSSSIMRWGPTGWVAEMQMVQEATGWSQRTAPGCPGWDWTTTEGPWSPWPHGTGTLCLTGWVRQTVALCEISFQENQMLPCC